MPELFDEVPERPLRRVAAMQHKNTNESALAIAYWLSENGTTAWVFPKGPNRFQPATLRIEFAMKGNILVGPGDYVLVDQERHQVYVLSELDFNSTFEPVTKEKDTVMPVHETPIETPEPPKETDLGKDSTSADEMAQIGEDELVAEELATDE